ncbi:hypothetical protein [Halorubrum sp. DTA98]|uniref:hypothetical protein n=1 Tax=Halorubrum sp. DTA98 TaxID=3402163 RepID=UPI003AAE6FAD
MTPLVVVSIAVVVALGIMVLPGAASVVDLGEVEDVGIGNNESQTIHDIVVWEDSDPIVIEVGDLVEAGAELDPNTSSYEISNTQATEIESVTIEDRTTSNAKLIVETSTDSSHDEFDFTISNIDTTNVSTLDSSLSATATDLEYKIERDGYEIGTFSVVSNASVDIDSEAYDHTTNTISVSNVQLEDPEKDHVVIWETDEDGEAARKLGTVQGQQDSVSIDVEELTGEVELIAAVHPDDGTPNENVIYAGDIANVDAPENGSVNTTNVTADPDHAATSDSTHSVNISVTGESAATGDHLEQVTIEYDEQFVNSKGNSSAVESEGQLVELVHYTGEGTTDLSNQDNINISSSNNTVTFDFSPLETAPQLSDGDQLILAYDGVENPHDSGEYLVNVSLRDGVGNEDTSTSSVQISPSLVDGDVALQNIPLHFATSTNTTNDSLRGVIEIPFNIAIDDTRGSIEVELTSSQTATIDLGNDTNLYTHTDGQLVINTSGLEYDSPLKSGVFPSLNRLTLYNIHPEGEGEGIKSKSTDVQFLGETISGGENATIFKGSKVAIESEDSDNFSVDLNSSSESIRITSGINSRIASFDTTNRTNEKYSVSTSVFSTSTTLEIEELNVQINPTESVVDTETQIEGKIEMNGSDRPVNISLANEAGHLVASNFTYTTDEGETHFSFSSQPEGDYRITATDLKSNVERSTSLSVENTTTNEPADEDDTDGDITDDADGDTDDTDGDITDDADGDTDDTDGDITDDTDGDTDIHTTDADADTTDTSVTTSTDGGTGDSTDTDSDASDVVDQDPPATDADSGATDTPAPDGDDDPAFEPGTEETIVSEEELVSTGLVDERPSGGERADAAAEPTPERDLSLSDLRADDGEGRGLTVGDVPGFGPLGTFAALATSAAAARRTA